MVCHKGAGQRAGHVGATDEHAAQIRGILHRLQVEVGEGVCCGRWGAEQCERALAERGV
jgi:hypothetical protein